MSYYVKMNCSVKIPIAHKDKLKKFLVELDSGKLRWIDPGFSNKPIVEAFLDLRYIANESPSHIEIECFDGENFGCDDTIWSHLAPVIEHGSYIECSGEDDTLWKWLFINGELQELSGEINYKYPKDEFADLMSKINELEKNDPFKILELTRDCSSKDIENAYKNKMKKYHPDLFSHLGQDFYNLANDKTKILNFAKNECFKIKGY